jgi:hypothetical protein
MVHGGIVIYSLLLADAAVRLAHLCILVLFVFETWE